MVHKRSISIILPNYNGAKLLEKYLPFTLTSIQNAGVPFEIMVVDDASKDQSVSYLQSNYPEILVISNPQNKGFSHTCNTGIRAAKHELIMLLNTDVKLSPDYFEHQFRYFEREDTFGVMGRIVDMEGDHIQDAARKLSFSGFKLKTNHFFYSENPEDLVPTAYLSGANALIDATKLKAIGGFNELFSPFYGEDFEMGLRAWRCGWKCWYEHHSVCRHQISASTKDYKTRNWVKSVYYRNRFFVHAIHLNGFYLIGWFLQVLLELIPQLLTGKFWLLKSYWQLFRNQPQIISSRKQFAALMQENSGKRSIEQVIAEINGMIKGLKITG